MKLQQKMRRRNIIGESECLNDGKLFGFNTEVDVEIMYTQLHIHILKKKVKLYNKVINQDREETQFDSGRNINKIKGLLKNRTVNESDKWYENDQSSSSGDKNWNKLI